ncbi:MAG: hypothetical protein NTX14_02615 [Candidatus Nealsonbacteria bacterium]|nr:hypothetical protein [Candidatus Nealsonbacteria bacterium]
MGSDCFIEAYGKKGVFRLALEKGPSQTAKIIIGHLSPERETLIEELLADYPGRLDIRLSQEPSEHHLQIIGANICVESSHGANKPYEYAYIIERESEEGMLIARKNFADLENLTIPITHRTDKKRGLNYFGSRIK